MLVIERTGKCLVYRIQKKANTVKKHSKIKVVNWEPALFINDLQPELLWRTRYLYLFTPDFSHYLNYHYNSKQWVVKPTSPVIGSTNPQDNEVYIPEDFLTIVFK
jgi:hypothetical protein